MKLILGSQSVSRRLALESTGQVFDVMPADIDEKAIRSEDYEQLPVMIAKAKAAALLARLSVDAILITADQVVECAGEMREKPEDEVEARRFLASYATEPAQTNSAVVVTNTRTGEQVTGLDIAQTYFKPMSGEVVDLLIADGAILQAAGAFIIEHPLMAPYIDRIEGAPDSVMGLPLELTQRLIEAVS
jgi:septum formation protein